MATIMVNGMTVDTDKVLPKAYTYNGSNQLVTESFMVGTATFTKTYTYTGSNMTGESAWVQS